VRPAFTAIVLAGDRGEGDPVATAAGVPCKALAPVGGRAIVLRVLDALRAADEVGDILMVGPERERITGCAELNELVATGVVGWLAPGPTPATSAGSALATIARDAPVLVTTADHALLAPNVVDHFCVAARESGRELLAAVAEHAAVVETCPGVRRTVLKLRGDRVCGCNLFAFLTPRAREVASFWTRVEALRKQPLRMVGMLGWSVVLRYALGRLTLDQALAHLSRKTGVDLDVVRLPFPEAAVDVDTAADLTWVRSRVEEA